jgi:2-oxoglutarate ferredoxin oxidoreductase subunit gamma
MLMVGALLAELPMLPLKVIEKALKDHTPERHQSMVPANIQALRKGVDFRAGKSRAA